MKALLFVVLTCLIASTVWAQQPWALYDFSDAAQLNDWEILHGEWKIKDGALRYEGDNAATPLVGIVAGDEKWDDYTMEFLMKVVEFREVGGTYLGAVVRYVDDENLQGFQGYNAPANFPRGIFYHRPKPDKPWGNAPEEHIGTYSWTDPDKKSGTHDGKPHEVKILAKGDKYSVWIDRQMDPIIDFEFGEGPKEGKIGFTGWQEGIVEYDDVYVGPPSGKWFVRNIKPQGKLTTMWGNVKFRY